MEGIFCSLVSNVGRDASHQVLLESEYPSTVVIKLWYKFWSFFFLFLFLNTFTKACIKMDKTEISLQQNPGKSNSKRLCKVQNFNI